MVVAMNPLCNLAYVVQTRELQSLQCTNTEHEADSDLAIALHLKVSDEGDWQYQQDEVL